MAYPMSQFREAPRCEASSSNRKYSRAERVRMIQPNELKQIPIFACLTDGQRERIAQDLDHAKTSVLNSLSSPRSRRNYKFAMEQFIDWYCSEPRLALNRTVVLRFRLHLESLGLAAGTINQRLAAVRRLAYEAADSGLLSPELAAGIRRVKGVKQLGCRAGNWLNQHQARLLLERANGQGLRHVRDVAMIAILLGCGLRRAELSALRKEDIQVRQGHWAIGDLVGKGIHVRTVPMPGWGKNAIDRWLTAASVTT